MILGATGATGRHLLQELLQSSTFTRFGEYGRRVTPGDNITTGKEKLEQKTIDFEKLEEAGLKDGKWDIVYITYVYSGLTAIPSLLMRARLLSLGSTRAAAGSAAAFEKIDKE